MFVNQKTAVRIESAEATGTRAMVQGLVGSSRAPAAFLRDLGAGAAAFVRPESPMNKVIGAGIEGPIDESALGAIERAFHDEKEPVRIELTTVAAPETFAQLADRGYRLCGFENVLARSLAQLDPPSDRGVVIERATEATLPSYREAAFEGFCQPDDTGVVLDHFTREVVATVIDDSLLAPSFLRYVAYRDGALAGGASMQLHDGVAVLTGSATLSAHRRRGVQASLLARRLADAREHGATLAIITTSPGTQSQANVMKLGFSLSYARAILVLAAPPSFVR